MSGSQKTESQAREGLIGGISDQKADHLSVEIGVVRDPAAVDQGQDRLPTRAFECP
jgi:hypothetical protein